MDPGLLNPFYRKEWIPRTRGDGPGLTKAAHNHLRDSPHARGWTQRAAADAAIRRGFPARAGMELLADGFPARAGMDRRLAAGPAARRRIPRTRGDGPARPHPSQSFTLDSPHARGWTRVRRDDHVRARGFPARAGMDPRRSRTG